MTRLLVPVARMDEAADAAANAAREIVVGDPTDPATTMGPVISAHQRATIRDYISTGIHDGFQLLTGGVQPPPGLKRGFYVAPTVFADVDNRSRIAQEEIFGPVLVIIGYTNDDDAVAKANNSLYGLRGAVWSDDHDRALALARRLRTGQVDINGFKFGLHAPFGGYKQSGVGRTMGTAGYEEFLQTKAIQL